MVEYLELSSTSKPNLLSENYIPQNHFRAPFLYKIIFSRAELQRSNRTNIYVKYTFYVKYAYS